MRGFPGIVAAALLVAGCQQPAELKAEKAWVRLPAVAGNPGAAYFTLSGGDKPDTLLSVSTPAALKVELHESMKGEGGMMAMRPLKDVAVPARGTIAFEPGGRHVMLFGVGPNVKVGDKLPLSLAFAGGKTLTVQADVVGAGDPAPGHEGH
ncbi:copper chaperone PCu(A)C [Sphingomonas sp. CJ20]